MIRNIIYYIRRIRFLKKEKIKLNKRGTLLHAFKEKKIIFIHIPKTAGVSLIRSIYGNVSLESHRSINFYKKIFSLTYSDYFTFSFVRNPWDRLYSTYIFLEKGGMNIHDKNAFNMYLARYKNFEDFVINGLSENLISKIVHLIPQSEFICDKDNSILVDFLGRFEKLNESILELEREINTKIQIDHYNINKKKSYTEVYTEQMILKVQKIYSRDIKVFGYNFKDIC